MSILGIAVWVSCPHTEGKRTFRDPRSGECANCQGSDKVLKNCPIDEFVAMLSPPSVGGAEGPPEPRCRVCGAPEADHAPLDRGRCLAKASEQRTSEPCPNSISGRHEPRLTGGGGEYCEHCDADLPPRPTKPVIEVEYREGGWIKDGVMAICPECKRVKEGTMGWHVMHEESCKWKPAGTWFDERLKNEMALRTDHPVSLDDAYRNGWNAAIEDAAHMLDGYSDQLESGGAEEMCRAAINCEEIVRRRSKVGPRSETATPKLVFVHPTEAEALRSVVNAARSVRSAWSDDTRESMNVEMASLIDALEALPAVPTGSEE